MTFVKKLELAIRIFTQPTSVTAMIPRFGLFKALNIFSKKDQMRQFSLEIKTTDQHNFLLKSNFNLSFAFKAKEISILHFSSHSSS